MAAPDDAGGGAEASYYAILNVPREATPEEIKRAYRGLATVFHPDKHHDDALRETAQAAFAKLQARAGAEAAPRSACPRHARRRSRAARTTAPPRVPQEAYEVLSDPARRDVYDVYGKEGLTAGLAVGTKLKDVEELRREWEAFKAQQRAAREAAAASHRGIYVCKVDGRGWAHGDWAALPQIRMVVVQNSLDVAWSDADVGLLQGQAALRGGQGSGSVVAGYKRVLSPNDELEANAVLGLRSLLTVTSTRRLGHYTTAALTGSYNWEQGAGLQLSTTRQLTAAATGSLSWVVGPSGAAGMALSLSHRGARYAVSGKLDVGAVTSVSSRLTCLLSEGVSLKLTGRLGTAGVDGELGLTRRFGPGTTLYAGTAVSLQGGTAFKVRYARAGQVFEFPILLTGDPRDWEMLAAASVLPPLASFLALRYVLRPLRAWGARRAERAARAQHAAALRAAAARAGAERALLAPVARRKAAAEAAAEGLVVLEATYGVLHEWRLARAAAAAAAGQQPHGEPGGAAQPQQQQQQPADLQQPDQARRAPGGGKRQRIGSPRANGAAPPADGAAPGAPGEPAAAGAGAAGEGGGETEEQGLPAAWLDVTEALQYLVAGGKLELAGGVSKLGLMGFADVAPSADKELYVAYAHRRQLFEKVVADGELLRLPGAGEPVADAGASERLWARYRAAAAPAAGQ
ncbi:ATJ13 [Scenedesmus sp. PABB004]|nr:ATJ13 [Scenedesmus sp. PABB004]